MPDKLTQANLKKLFNYNPETGVFTRKIYRSSNAKKRDIAGYKDPSGYLDIRIKGRLYKSHRLAWLYMYGYFPKGIIDHINRIKTDNRACNLRKANRQCNAVNSKVLKNNTSNIKGISWDKKNSKWEVSLMINQKKKRFGRFKSKIKAAYARRLAEINYGWDKLSSLSSSHDYLKINLFV